MKKIRNGKILLKDIKHVENSRLRNKDDVGDLMQDIEQRGLLQPVGIRELDKALIFGNRRVKAYENLNFEEIDCTFYDEVSNEDLLVMNLAENIKRKKIGSVEIGRICKMLVDKGMKKSEIAVKLGINVSRVRSSVSAFVVTIGTPFEKLVVFGEFGKNTTGISESLIWKLNESLHRAIGRKITKAEWNILLDACENGKITSHNVSILRATLMTQNDMSIGRAIDILESSKVVYAYMNLNRKVLATEMKKNKFISDVEFIRYIIKDFNSDLLF